MTIVSRDNAEHYVWGDGCDGWHLVKSPSLSIIQERVSSGSSESRHFHIKAEQFFFILSGIATLEVNGEILKVHPSQGLHIPAGVPHKIKNDGSDDLSFIVTSTPPSHNDRIEAYQVSQPDAGKYGSATRMGIMWCGLAV